MIKWKFWEKTVVPLTLLQQFVVDLPMEKWQVEKFFQISQCLEDGSSITLMNIFNFPKHICIKVYPKNYLVASVFDGCAAVDSVWENVYRTHEQKIKEKKEEREAKIIENIIKLKTK
jgi:hypothetical protein